MISLKAFGGLELRAGEGHDLQSIVAQPKRQALLLYLAVAQPRGFHRRETLLGMFWPELDDAHARAALSRAVHYLRQSLGNDVVLSRGHEEIGLDWSRLWCDVAGFENALDSGRIAEGLALYRGDLLPGFYLDDTPGFEEWLGKQRERLRNRAVQSAWWMSEHEQEAGRGAGAIEWARRAVAMSPFDEPAARRLISMLDAAGDRAGAIREFDELRARLRDTLEVEPAPETSALIHSIRQREAAPSEPRMAAVPAAAPLAAPSTEPHTAPRHQPWRRVLPWAAIVVLVALGTLTAVVRRARVGAAAETRATVAVMPFVVQGDSGANYLSAGMVSLLAERFNQGGQLRALDARAVLSATQGSARTLDAGEARTVLAKLRPRFIVTGMVSATRDSVTITAVLSDSAGIRVRPARAAVSGRAADIGSLVQTVAAQLMLAQPTGGITLTPESYTALTPSLEALKHYVTGEEAYAAGHFHEAVRAYRAAVETDTTFALAFLWLSRAANWAGDQPTMGWAADRALKFSDKLALLNQFRVRGWVAYQRGQAEEAERFYQVVLANDVAAADAWLTIGELRYHWGPLLGWTQPQARDAFERAVAISARDVGSLIHLARLAAADGRIAALDSLIRRAGTDVDDLQSLELRGLRAFSTGDRTVQKVVLDAIDKLDDGTAQSTVLLIAASTGQHPDAAQLAAALTPARRSPLTRAIGAMLGAQLAMAHGKWREADALLVTGNALPPRRALEYRAALAALPFHSPPPNELRALLNTLAALPPTPFVGPWFNHYATNEVYGPRRSYLLGMLALKLGDSARVAATIRELEAEVDEPGDMGYRRDFASLLRAEMLRARGRPADALSALGAPNVLPDSVLPGILTYPSAHERWLRAELFRQLGEHAEALRWYETFPDPAAYDLMYLAPVHFGKAAVYRSLGKHAAAREEQRKGDALRVSARSP